MNKWKNKLLYILLSKKTVRLSTLPAHAESHTRFVHPAAISLVILNRFGDES